MDLVGFEPTTSSMPWKRAPNCATGPRHAAIPRLKVGFNLFILPQLLRIVKPEVPQDFENMSKISILIRTPPPTQ